LENPVTVQNVRRPRRRWEDNIEVDLEEIRREEVDWIHQAQDRDQWLASSNTLMNCLCFLKARGFNTQPGDYHSVIITQTEGVNCIGPFKLQ
jgi:hypothetical protein